MRQWLNFAILAAVIYSPLDGCLIWSAVGDARSGMPAPVRLLDIDGVVTAGSR